MTKGWFYDVEVFHNLLLIVFTPISLKQDLVDEYIKHDLGGKLKTLDINSYRQYLKIKYGMHTIVLYNNQYDTLDDIVSFLESNTLYIGFNNHAYDDYILRYLLSNYQKFRSYRDNQICKAIKIINDDIIGGQRDTRYYSNQDIERYIPTYQTMDIRKTFYLDAIGVGLKQVSINLKWYKVQEYKMPNVTDEELLIFGNEYKNVNPDKLESFERYVHPSHLFDILSYCVNDVLITHRLYHWNYEEIQIRVGVTNEYKINVLSQSRSKIGDTLMTKLYSDYTNLKYWDFAKKQSPRRIIRFREIIDTNINFESDSLKTFLSKLRTTEFKIGNKFEEIVCYNDVYYQFATGGLHTKDKPAIYEEDDEFFLVDADVGSFYPRIMINLMIAPEHLNKQVFISILRLITDERIVAKKAKNKAKAEALKIVINGLYGKLGSEYSWLRDEKAMYSVTINGQLYLLNLAERLESIGCKVISGNTDGITCKVPKSKIDDYYKVCEVWQKDFSFELEYVYYEKYCRRNVNSYLAIKQGFKSKVESGIPTKDLYGEYVKTKNDFVSSIKIDKGYNMPIVAKAIFEYFVNDVSIKDFIINHRDIYDFCCSQKTGGQFEVNLVSIKDNNINKNRLQKNNRYYVSNKGGALIKYSTDTKKASAMRKGVVCTVFNDYYEVDDFKEYDINYNYYISKAYEIVNTVYNQIKATSPKKSNSLGGLFGNF